MLCAYYVWHECECECTSSLPKASSSNTVSEGISQYRGMSQFFTPGVGGVRGVGGGERGDERGKGGERGGGGVVRGG